MSKKKKDDDADVVDPTSVVDDIEAYHKGYAQALRDSAFDRDGTAYVGHPGQGRTLAEALDAADVQRRGGSQAPSPQGAGGRGGKQPRRPSEGAEGSSP